MCTVIGVAPPRTGRLRVRASDSNPQPTRRKSRRVPPAATPCTPRRGSGCPLRTRRPTQFAELTQAIEVRGTRRDMEHARHPPGEVLCLPDPVERLGGELVEQPLVAVEKQGAQRPLEHEHVGDGEIHALRARRRNRVGGVADDRDAARCAVRARRSCGTAGRRAGRSVPPERRAGHARLQLVPQLRLRQRVRVSFRFALEVHPLHRGAALADEGEPVGRVAVDQLVSARRVLRTGCRTTRTGTRGSSRRSTSRPPLRRRRCASRRRRRRSRPRSRSVAVRAVGGHDAGRMLSASSTRCTVTPKRRSCPAARRAAMRSFSASCCGYSHTLRPTSAGKVDAVTVLPRSAARCRRGECRRCAHP